MSLLGKLIKVAHEHPEIREHLVPIIKEAMVFDTDRALDQYMKAHPGADKSNHSVKKDEPEKEEKKVEPKKEPEKAKKPKKPLKKPSLVRPEDKDFKRIEDMSNKARGRDHMKALARQMANSITDAEKALRRARAAEDWNYHEVAKVFFDRAMDLGYRDAGFRI